MALCELDDFFLLDLDSLVLRFEVFDNALEIVLPDLHGLLLVKFGTVQTDMNSGLECASALPHSPPRTSCIKSSGALCVK